MQRKLPSYPIFIKDPYFSLWQNTEALNEANVTTWFGSEKPIYGFIKANCKTYCFMGKFDNFANLGIKKAEQIDLEVSSFKTNYTFKLDDATFKISFTSPLLPTDLDLLSLPVCYLEYEVIGASDVEVSLFANQKISYNDNQDTPKSVFVGVNDTEVVEYAYVGLKKQELLTNNGDKIGADYGWWYLSGEDCCTFDEEGLIKYLNTGVKDSFSYQGSELYIGSTNKNTKGVILLGFDDVVSINYFGDLKKGYYLENHTIFEGLDYVYNNYENINKKLDEFDKNLKNDALKYGEEYYNLLIASLRQSIGAHKLIRDNDGKLIFLSKECASNGCIGTVDVSYPSIPLFLLYNTELIKGMMRPIFKFSRFPVWKFDFAPHDVGTYPNCLGQVYGYNFLKERKHIGNLKGSSWVYNQIPIYSFSGNYDAYDFDSQMPVEESANMLIMTYACYFKDGDISIFIENKDLFDKWVNYLVKYGLKPENQLCTDDFSGHLKNNINLSIKAIVGIGCYANLLKAINDNDGYKKYIELANSYSKEIMEFSKNFKHLPITWDSNDDTFSLKYNFAFDKILGLNLFSQELYEKEVLAYLDLLNEFGVPLDNRENYTKSDWLTWVASLTNDINKQKTLIKSLTHFLENSVDRIPFTDLYDTKSSKYNMFMARSVQGGCFILLLNK